jgi:hypothetical protein
MKTKTLPKTYEFEAEERNLLAAELKLSMIDPANYPMTAEKKEVAWRALKEDYQIKKYLNHLDVKAENKKLAELCRVENSAEDLREQFEDAGPLDAMLLDQMAAVHKAAMAMLGGIYREDGVDLDICEKYINIANKLMKTYQSGLQTLNQAKTAGKQTIVVKHQNVQVNGGQAIVANEVTGDGGEEIK